MESKVLILTGAASGIGHATALQLLQQGATIIATDIQQQALEDAFTPLKPTYAERLHVHPLDVTNRPAVRSIIQSTRERFGRLDGYANVAGTGGHRLGHEAISETTDEEFDFIIDLNVRATFIALGEVLRPGILASGGSVVCVGSMFGQRGFRKGAVFAGSKHAMVGMVKSAALEVGERGVRVNVVEPGAIDTPMHRKNMESGMPDPTPANPIPRLGTAEDVAAVICFLLSDSAAYVTGSVYRVDGGANT